MSAELWKQTASELAAAIACGAVSSSEVVEAHIARIEAVNPALNAVVYKRYDDARREAQLADEKRARGEDLGALHGVPVTIKDSQDIAGTPATFGLPSRANDRAERDGTYVARWRAAGAIPIAKTNLSQLMIFIESDNPLFGRTNNPWNFERSCGGSSGGEGAIVAAGGSPLGLGADIGGSLRVPAAFNGIASFKPTTGRMDDTTRLDVYAGQRAIVSQEGPLARCVADLELGLAIANGGNDPGVYPRRALGDPRAIDIASLRVGYYENAGAFRASPGLGRAAREAALALQERGARVTPFEPPLVDEAMDIFFGIFSADRARGAIVALEHDPRDPRVAELIAIASKPRAVVAAIARVLALTGQAGLLRMVRNYGFNDVRHYWKLVEALETYKALFAKSMDDAAGGPLDLIIAPPVGLAAIKHGAAADVSTAGAYAPLYNLLGYPAGTLPWTTVRADEEHARKRTRDRVERGAYDSETGSAGLPICVQIVGRPWREDVVFAAMYALETIARTRPDFPITPVRENAATSSPS
jgi:fatty acid amide hydrolase